MAETGKSLPDDAVPLNDLKSSTSSSALFPHRRIEFQLARKSFNRFSNGNGGFQLETLNPGVGNNNNNNNMNGLRSGQSGAATCRDGRRRDGPDLAESGLDPEFSFGMTVRRIGAGLENLGNTCFLNSVLQCLTHTEPLAAYLQTGKHQISCRKAGFCALCAIQSHVKSALQSTGRSLAPKDLVYNLRCISRNFQRSRQEDAHEYMVNLLESMHKCSLPSGVPSESPSAYEKSLVHKIFGGSLRSQVKCMQCSSCSNKFDPFLDLSLEIAKAETLEKAFAHFTAKEQLDGGKKEYHCQQCKQKVKALKQLTIHKVPRVLTIHLKRFGSHISGQKIDKKIHFAPTLDLKPFVSGPYDGDLKYTLYGVLVHAGWSTHSGHYYCFVRTSSGIWYALDDNKVSPVSERKVFEQKAYMLFYFRDGKSFLQKKPDDSLKDKAGSDGIGKNYACANIAKGPKELAQSGVVDNTILLNSAASVPHRDPFTCLSKETPTKAVSVQDTTCSRTCSTLNVDSHLESSLKVPLPCDLLNPKLPVLNAELPVLQNVEEQCLGQPNSSPKLSKKALIVEDTMNTTPEAAIAECSSEGNAKNDPSSSDIAMHGGNEMLSLPLNFKDDASVDKCLGDSASLPANCTLPPTSPGDECIAEETCSLKKNISAPSADPGSISSVKGGVTSPVCLTNREDVPVQESSQELPVVISFCENSVSDAQRLLDIESAEQSIIRNIKSLPSLKKSDDSKSHRKKKLLLRQGACRQFGWNKLLTLSLIKKQQHKQSKKAVLRIKNPSHRDLLDGGCLSMDAGASTSEKNNTVPQGGGVSHSRRKKVKRVSNIECKNSGENVPSSSGVVSSSAFESELQQRIDVKDGTVLATADRVEKHSDSALVGSLSYPSGMNSFKDDKSSSKQKELLRMLMAGLDERVVARWGEEEASPSQIADSSVSKSVTIGYVGDDWDEALDRGKRKKIRNSREIFDARNLFQEVATKKAKSNYKSMFDQSSSGNKPYRI